MTVSKAQPGGMNPLAQLGNAFNEAGQALQKMLKGAPANAATAPAGKNGADKKNDKASHGGKRPGGADVKKNAASKQPPQPQPQPRMCGVNDGAKYVPKAGRLIGADGTGSTKVEVIYKFEYDSYGQSLKADNGFVGTGLGKKRDRTFQLVQYERIVKDSKTGQEVKAWEVYIQPTGEGRKDANIHIFSSSRKVKASDFNVNDAAIRRNMAVGFARLNADSNRLPETPKAEAPKQPDRWWIDQQARNAVGGLSSAGTSIVGTVGSLPENAVKVGSSIGNTSRATVNLLTGGAVGKTAFNPLTTDKHSRYYNAPTNVERSVRGVQEATNESLGADANSLIYKTVSVGAPILLTRGRGKSPGKPGGSQKQLMPVKGEPVNFSNGKTPTGGTPQPGTTGAKLNEARALDKPVKVVRGTDSPLRASKSRTPRYDIVAERTPNGGIKMTQNRRPMSLNDVAAAVKRGQLNKAQLKGAGFSDQAVDGIMQQASKGAAPGVGVGIGVSVRQQPQPQPATTAGSKPNGKPGNAPKQLAPAAGSQQPVQLGGGKPSSSAAGGKPINNPSSGSGGGITQPKASSPRPQPQPDAQRSRNNPGTIYADPPAKPLDLNAGPLRSTSAPIVPAKAAGKPVQQPKSRPIAQPPPTTTTGSAKNAPPQDKTTQAQVDAANRMQSNPYQPAESFNDARQRRGAMFNQQDYHAGAATPRMSQDPPDLGSSVTGESANRPNTTAAGSSFQDIGETYFRGENLSLNYNGKPVDHIVFAGKNLSVKDVARLSRAPDGSTIHVTSHAMLRDQLSIAVSNSGVFNRDAGTELWRSQSTGDIFVKNMMFDSQSKAPSGFGLSALWEQAKAARAMGVKSIQSDAFASGTKPSNTQYIGPYVWGKYGFDAELPHEVLVSIQAPSGVTTVAEIYQDRALTARWKNYVLNHSFNLTMHLDLNGSGFDRLSDVIGKR
jgi:hypothetical protein